MSDITYFAKAHGWVCLTVTQALFNRKFAGWHLAENVQTAPAIQAAQKATTRKSIGPEIFTISDLHCEPDWRV